LQTDIAPPGNIGYFSHTAMIKNLLSDDDEPAAEQTPDLPSKPRPTAGLGLFDAPEEPADDGFIISRSRNESAEDTARRSGLAWAAGIVFFSSVVFMMILGWGADLLFGSSPWGVVGGIVLGSLIGFVQFFRISTQIFRK
jgi:hypothetical protein